MEWTGGWSRLVRWSIVIGLLSDLLNLTQMARMYGRTPPGEPIVYEDLAMSRLPECAFEEIYEEEAGPVFYLNFLDWLLGMGTLKENAYTRAEEKIWRKVAAERSGASPFSQIDPEGGGPQVMQERERRESQGGLKQIRKTFYFDRSGYHVRLSMGRLRPEGTAELFNPGCEVDPARGEIRTRTTSAIFTCESLTRVIQRNVERIQSVDSERICWSSLSYQTDYLAKRITFTAQYYFRQEDDLDAF